MINDNLDMYMATTITENWIGDETTEHSIDISNYKTMMDYYGDIEEFNDVYNNKATIKDGILTTTMKTLYGSNNRCHYGKFGAAIIACDAAKNMYQSLNGNNYGIILADSSGSADIQKNYKLGETIIVPFDITNNKVIRKEIIQEEQKKENEIYDINELIKNAVKDNVKEEIVEDNTKEDYLKKLRLSDADMEKEVSDDIDINIDEEELMKTANLSLDILSDLKGDNEDTVVSAVLKDETCDEDSQFYSDKYHFDKSDFEDFDVNDEDDKKNVSDGKFFWKIFFVIFGLSLIILVFFLLF